MTAKISSGTHSFIISRSKSFQALTARTRQTGEKPGFFPRGRHPVRKKSRVSLLSRAQSGRKFFDLLIIAGFSLTSLSPSELLPRLLISAHLRSQTWKKKQY
ncbi:Uncharacterized protein dnm_012130 [Desulfonema magnum]|uniref:Uncharacterized protein n=1 Tax=Desulfonema magnum TaxID=45655 RepID=A0A975BH55_9BACT|nr:Uncharacterized protein dnm_012130 [Desulfonema magnum]